MTFPEKKLAVIGLQQSFLKIVLDQIRAIFSDRISARPIAIEDVASNPPRPGDTLLYFNREFKPVVDKVSPKECNFILGRRENLIFNMQQLFKLESPRRILVVNDMKNNIRDMTDDLQTFGLGHEFIPYYPENPVPEGINCVVTAGDPMLVPPSLDGVPVIDIGYRYIALSTIYKLYKHFGISFDPAVLARHYMRQTMMLSEKQKKTTIGGLSQETKENFSSLARAITLHGFLEEGAAILSIYMQGKKQNKALGRAIVLDRLKQKGYAQTVQQLRLKLERMDSMELLIVRPGRGGTTLSEKGEAFLRFLTRDKTAGKSS